MRKIIISFIFFAIAALLAPAQSQMALNMSEGGYGLLKTNFGVTYDHGWNSAVNGVSVRGSYEFLRTRKFTVTANLRYASTEMSFNPSDLSEGFDPDDIGLNGWHHSGQTGVTSTFRSKLAGKPLMAMALANAEWGKGGFARISGIAMGIVMLRANRATQFGIGALVMLNTSSRIPAFPILMYRHAINEKWRINIYGGIMGLEYAPTRTDLLSMGGDINVKSFYFKPSDSRLPSKCRFTNTSFRPQIKYRRRLMANLYLDVAGGASVKMSCRANGVSSRKEYFDCSQKVAPFIQTGISYSL